jgi:dipeptidyl aminopeptidase/acylaminoacyl peptidase
MNYLKTLLLIHIFISPWSNVEASEKLSVRDFVRHAKYLEVKISPDAKHLAYTFREGNQIDLAILNRSSGEVVQVFDFGQWKQVIDFDWANNLRVIMSVQKKVGKYDKKGGKKNLYAANIDSPSKRKIFSPETSSFKIVSLLNKDPKNIIILKTNNVDKKSDLAAEKVNAIKLNIYSGKMRRISGQPKASVSNILFDSNDQMRIATQYVPDRKNFGFGEYFVFIKNLQSGQWDRSSIIGYTAAKLEVVGISEGANNAFVITDMNARNTGLYLFDLKNGRNERLYLDEHVDIGEVIHSAQNKVIGFNYSPAFNQVKLIDNKHRESRALLDLFEKFPGQDVRFTSYTKKTGEAIVAVTSDKNPGAFYLFNFTTGSVEHLLSARPWINPNQMLEMQPIKYTSRDGIEIFGYLTLPKGSNKNLPLIVLPHGGPHSYRDHWRFNSEIQFIASRGYAVLQMNFRGSGGYGQEFEVMGYRQWGRKMQDDVTDATHWAIKNGVADPDRICIYGGSYGGYSALMGVIREPDLYQCAIGYVGVYDLEDHLIHGDMASSTAGVNYIKHVTGEDKSEWHRNSPAKNVEKIKAKLFIAHGRDDVRVPMSQYELLDKALKKANIPYRSMLRDDGHGYTKIKNRIDFYTAMEEFFRENLSN